MTGNNSYKELTDKENSKISLLAKASWICPLVICFTMFSRITTTKSILPPDLDNPNAIADVTFKILIILAGVVMGIIAITKSRKRKVKGIFGHSIFGIIFSIGTLCLFLFMFHFGSEQNNEIKKHVENFSKSNEEINSSKSLNDSEKKAYITLSNWKKNSSDLNSKLQVFWKDLSSPRFLDSSLLKNEGEFEYQKKLVQAFITNAEACKINFVKMPMHFRTELSGLDYNNKTVKGVLSAIDKKFEKESPFTLPLFDARMDYGYKLQKLITFLENNNSSWSSVDNKFVFESVELASKFNMLTNYVDESHKAIGVCQKKYRTGLNID
ncbi:MAG: hypothetical protein COA79_21355 [Planctomycetota bacterium]|nr:MAG: hypothetical protein COA79_21355 [Planctomycetota bacterium]